jgi:rsbT co-antagonist protein RsbR
MTFSEQQLQKTLADHRSVEELIHLYEIKQQDHDLIKKVSSFMLDELENLVLNWYKWLETQPEYDHFFSDQRILSHAQKQQDKYWRAFLAGEINEDYIEYRRLIGETHARIGLSMTVFFGGMSMFDSLFREILQEQNLPAKENILVSDAVAKQLHLDCGIVCEMFTYVMNEAISGHSKALMEMSTPVTEIWDGILLLPVVGIVDSKRSQDIMNAVLAMISKTKAKEFILDISGVGVVDTAVANYFIKITKATRLMGCESTISGVSPAIAQTIVQLGIDIGTVKTTATMMDAIDKAFQRQNLQIITLKN